jgi:disulfide bond formation protein DsbB
MPWAAALVLLAGVGALAAATIAQYGFGVQPCELCYWQRTPYGLAIVLGGLALVLRPYDARARVMLGVAALGFLAGMGIAIYHTGVEQHWWTSAAGCAVKTLGKSNLGDMSINDIRNQLLATVSVPCDEITWSFLGLSMANWNIMASLALALFAAIASFGCVTGEGTCCCCCSKTEKKEPSVL